MDTSGITTIVNGKGRFRAYNSMMEQGKIVWNPSAEILTLVNHGWRRA